MKIVFFGTPNFAKEILEDLIERGVEIVAVVTQPDRPKGRSSKLSPSPVKELVLTKHLPIEVLQPLKASEEHFLNRLKELRADLYVVVAFGQILPQKLLDIPRFGCINVHASLLPKYRGAAPMQRSLMNGDLETGIAIQKMVLKMDAGDVLAVSKTDIPQNMTLKELEKKLISLTKPLLAELLLKYEKEEQIQAVAQDVSLVTYAPKIESEDALIDWDRPNNEVHNLIRALSPKPGAWCWVEIDGEKKRLKILKSHLSSDAMGLRELVGTKVGCKKGSIELVELQVEGKKPMSARDWLRGQKRISF